MMGKGEQKFPNVVRDDWEGSLGEADHCMIVEGDEAIGAACRTAHGRVESQRSVKNAATRRRSIADACCCLTCGSVEE